MKKKHLYFLINTLGGGGAEKVLPNLTNALINDFDITVVCISGGINLNLFDKKIKLRILFPFKSKIFQKIIFFLIYKVIPFKLSAQFLLRGKHEMEIAFLEGLPTHLIVHHKSTSQKISYIHTDLSNDINASFLKKCQTVKEYNSFDKVVFVSGAAKNEFEKSFGKLSNSIVLHNIVDSQKIKELAAFPVPLIKEKDGFNLIAIGRLVPIKSFDRLIRVINRINRTNICVNLYILGQGDLESELIELANNLGCDNITFLGYEENPYKYINKADLTISSSLHEGYCTAIIESLILGTPVLTTDSAGMKEIFSGANCGLIVDNNEDALYEGLKTLLTDPSVLAKAKQGAIKRGNELGGKASAEENIRYYKSLFD